MSRFASCGKEEQEEIYPHKISEIEDARQADKHLSLYFRQGAGLNQTGTKGIGLGLVLVFFF